MSAYDEKEALRESLKSGIPHGMVAALTGTYPKSGPSLVGLGQRDGVAADDVDKRIPVAASGTQEKAPSVVNLGCDGAKHDFEAAAPALPHDCAPVSDRHGTADGDLDVALAAETFLICLDGYTHACHIDGETPGGADEMVDAAEQRMMDARYTLIGEIFAARQRAAK